jgi:hypothetical protein
MTGRLLKCNLIRTMKTCIKTRLLKAGLLILSLDVLFQYKQFQRINRLVM